MKKPFIAKIMHKAHFANYALQIFLVIEAVISVFLVKDYIHYPFSILILLLFALYIGVLVRLYSLLKGKRIDKTRIKKCIKPLLGFIKSYIFLIAAIICLVMPQIILYKKTIRVESEKSDNIQIFYGQESYETENYYGDYSLSKNIRYLKYVLSDEEYQALDYEEKLKVIESILQWEANRLGVPHFEFKCEELPDNIAGEYCCEPVDTITINKKCIENGYHIECVSICCIHEVRHLYQFSLCKLWLKLSPEQRALKVFEGEHVEDMLANYRDYKQIEDDFDKYNAQYVERDADIYAEEELSELLQEIKVNYYLSEY